MKRSPLALLFSFALLLSACGGGGGTPPTGGTTSTPAPTPTPTPTPNGGIVQGTGTPLSGAATFDGGWSPYGVASGLDLPVQHGWNGTGQTVAIVIDSDVSRTVISAYLAQFGITHTGTITTISVDGSSGIATNGDQDEAYLDVETIAGLAPGANIRIYQIKDLLDASIAKAYSRIDTDGVATVVNSSFGGCEVSNAPEDPYITQGAQAGILYVASGGDNGNVCNPPSQVGANWPASNPNVIGAGGTETRLATGNAVTSDTVWNDTSCVGTPSQCAGGGGVSTLYPLPSYQSGLAGKTSSTFRNVPDISMPAESDTIDDGSWVHLNGTSWASPQYAALMAELYEYCHVSNGIANPVGIPYYVFGADAQAFIDVIHGNDQYQGTTPFYTAGTGYDNASGLGVPHGMTFANTACPGGVKAAGLLARSAMTFAAQAPQRRSGAFSLDVTPRIAGLVDRGERAADAATAVQIVLHADADRTAVENALQQAGFSIERNFRYAGLIDAQAPAAAVEQFFGTRIHDVAQGADGMRYAPAARVVVPASIAPFVNTVSIGNVVTRHVL